MAEAQIGQEKWKSARDFATTTTQVSVVLFAALIASWVGMWDHLNQYRGAAASREGIERQHRIAQEREQAVLKEAIRGRLLSDVLAIHGKPEAEQKARREEFLKLVTAKDFDPELTLRSLSKGDWKASLLSSAINTERVRLYRERLSAIAQFERRRAPAEKTSFKLLGLEFSVNGFWSWIVWMLFFCGGLVYLSLSRRALIRRCRSTWSVLSDEAKLPDEHLRSMAETLPVWARPLPQAEPWVEVLTNRPRLDAVLDPMSMLCVALMIACTGLVILVAWIGIISTSLLGGAKNVLLEPTLHAAMLCILCGLMVGILLGWGAVPNDHRRFWFRRKRRDADTVEVFGRRTWMMAIVGIGMGALAYSTCINKALVYLLLRRPRFRKSTSRRHPGPSTRANEPGRLKTGFYLDSRQRIHYVPESGRAHSLLGQVESGLQPWSGPFNSISLGRVHPRALIPFLREAVKTKTRGLQHRKDAAQR